MVYVYTYLKMMVMTGNDYFNLNICAFMELKSSAQLQYNDQTFEIISQIHNGYPDTPKNFSNELVLHIAILEACGKRID
jgi:hypothetical protein